MLRAAIAFRDGGYGMPVLVGRDDVHDRLRALGVDDPRELRGATTAAIRRACRRWSTISTSGCSGAAIMHRELERMVNQDRNIFASLLLALGEADAMITGVTRPLCAERSARSAACSIRKPGVTPFGIHVMVGKSHTVFIADTTVNERPTGRATRRHRRSRPPRSRGAWATSRASPSCPIRPSAIPTGSWLEQHPRRGDDARRARRRRLRI